MILRKLDAINSKQPYFGRAYMLCGVMFIEQPLCFKVNFLLFSSVARTTSHFYAADNAYIFFMIGPVRFSIFCYKTVKVVIKVNTLLKSLYTEDA